VIHTLIGDIQFVQQVIDPDFLGKPLGTVCGAAFI
jgi:arginine repressor